MYGAKEVKVLKLCAQRLSPGSVSNPESVQMWLKPAKVVFCCVNTIAFPSRCWQQWSRNFKGDSACQIEKKFYFCSCINVISFLSENSQQKGREEQEGHPENPKQHLRRRQTIQFDERGWVKIRRHSHLLWEIHDLIKIQLPSNVRGSILPFHGSR